MGILSNIFSKIFPSLHAANAPASSAAGPAAAAPGAVPAAPTAASAAPMPEINIEQMFDGMAAKSPEKLNWKTSIVDLMKLLGLDSSLQSRKELAQELHYTGDMNDSASMNVWLHRQVMNKVAANGGKVPADLIDSPRTTEAHQGIIWTILIGFVAGLVARAVMPGARDGFLFHRRAGHHGIGACHLFDAAPPRSGRRAPAPGPRIEEKVSTSRASWRLSAHCIHASWRWRRTARPTTGQDASGRWASR